MLRNVCLPKRFVQSIRLLSLFSVCFMGPSKVRQRQAFLRAVINYSDEEEDCGVKCRKEIGLLENGWNKNIYLFIFNILMFIYSLLVLVWHMVKLTEMLGNLTLGRRREFLGLKPGRIERLLKSNLVLVLSFYLLSCKKDAFW